MGDMAGGDVDQEEARRRFSGSAVAHLATADAEGRPHLVPMTFGYARQADAEVIFCAVDSKPKSTRKLKRLANVAANPAVSVLVDHYSEDWAQLWWVRADGRARIVHSGAEFNVVIAALQEKYLQYRAAPPAGPALVIDVFGWSSWSASS
jgi:PPOX class probable F420-dependent enzyme